METLREVLQTEGNPERFLQTQGQRLQARRGKPPPPSGQNPARRGSLAIKLMFNLNKNGGNNYDTYEKKRRMVAKYLQ